MFTGIVEELGKVVGVAPSPTGIVLTIAASTVLSDAREGDSIAVNGVCLTVRERQSDRFVADVMPETLDRTTVGELQAGDPVNLERAATLQTRLGGHLVQGHVDGVGTVTGKTSGERVDLTVAIPPRLARYLVPKGSITVDGVSLTVVDVTDATNPGTESVATASAGFTVSLIPTTLRATTLGVRHVGDRVNLEVDVIAQHVERLLTAGDAGTTAATVGASTTGTAGGAATTSEVRA